MTGAARARPARRHAMKSMLLPTPAHPIFGPLTVRQWGVQGYKHTDHHLRQFGV